MKALITVLMLVLVAVHVWLSHKRFQGPNQLFLKDEPVQLADGITMRTEYLDRILEGSVSDSGDVTAAIESTQTMQPPGRIINRLTLGSSIVANWSNGRLKLSGKIQDPSLKEKIIAAAAMPVDDQLEVNKNVAATEWALQLPDFLANFIAATQTSKQGMLQIQPDAVVLKGKVLSAEQKQSLLQRANSWGIPVSDQISFPQKPATLLATLNKGTLSLNGEIPSIETKNLIGAQAGKTGLKINNQLKVSDRVTKPKWIDQVSKFFPTYFKGTEKGEVEIGPDFVRLNREVKNPKAKEELIKGASGFGLKVVNQLAIPKPAKPTQPATILASLSNRTLRLSGQLPSDSLVKSVAETARRTMPNIKIANRLVADKKNVKNPSWNDQISPLFRDFFADKPESAEIEIGFQSVRMKKEVANQSAKQKLVAMARGISPNGKFIDQIAIKSVKVEPLPLPNQKPEPTPSKPASILAVLSNNNLTITGQVPNQELKNLLTKSAQVSLPDAQVSNRLVVDSKTIQIPSWGNSINDLFSSFWSARPDAAEFEITQTEVRLKQQLKSEGTRDLLLLKARRLIKPLNQRVTNQLTITKPKARPRPPRQAVTLSSPSVQARKPASVLVTYKNRQLTLSGQVPSGDMRYSIAEAALSARPKARINNKLVVDDEIRVPAWDLKVLNILSEFLSSTADSEFEVNPDQIRLKQALPSQAIKDAWVAKVNRFMPGSDRFIDQLVVSPNAPMPGAFDPKYRRPDTSVSDPKFETLEIYFLTNSTWVKPSHAKEIAEAARSLKQFSTLPRIEVKGFADQRGSYELNKRLSESRAEEVVKKLVEYGIYRSRIQVLAVGEAESKGADQRDRRVEIRIFQSR